MRRSRTGTIGKVKEVHSWSEKKWGDIDPGPDRATRSPGLNWDPGSAWRGAALHLATATTIPGNWRKRLDFGTGTFGDMGCHIFDPVFEALALTAPLSVRRKGAAPNEDSWATDTIIHYVFPGTKFTEGRNGSRYVVRRRPASAQRNPGIGEKQKPPPNQPWKLRGPGQHRHRHQGRAAHPSRRSAEAFSHRAIRRLQNTGRTEVTTTTSSWTPFLAKTKRGELRLRRPAYGSGAARQRGDALPEDDARAWNAKK